MARACARPIVADKVRASDAATTAAFITLEFYNVHWRTKRRVTMAAVPGVVPGALIWRVHACENVHRPGDRKLCSVFKRVHFTDNTCKCAILIIILRYFRNNNDFQRFVRLYTGLGNMSFTLTVCLKIPSCEFLP